MLTISAEQQEYIALVNLLERIEVNCVDHLPGFSELEKQMQHDWVVATAIEAMQKGFETEQGITAYALANWYLGDNFESKSQYLARVFQSPYPEVRKVYAMNEWVEAMLDKPNNEAVADEVLKKAFYAAEAWG